MLGGTRVYYTVKNYAALASVENMSPHTFRHTVATQLVRDPEVDLVTAATFLGHGRLDTTARYSRPSVEDLAEADVPQGGGEGAASLAFGTVAPKETSQPIPGLGVLPVHGQVGQQGLGLEGGGLVQWLVVAADIQRSEQIQL
jgi:hypothetical protein